MRYEIINSKILEQNNSTYILRKGFIATEDLNHNENNSMMIVLNSTQNS